MPNGPLDIKTFELWKDELHLYLDSKFTSVCNKIDAVTSVRREDCENCKDCKTEIEGKITTTRKYMVIGIALCAILAGAQIPAVQAAAVALVKLFF